MQYNIKNNLEWVFEKTIAFGSKDCILSCFSFGTMEILMCARYEVNMEANKKIVPKTA